MVSRRRSTVVVVVLASLAGLVFAGSALAAGSNNPVIQDCLEHPGGLTGHYTVAALRHALQVMSPDTQEYTSCPDVINRALLAAISGHGTGPPSSGGGGSGSFMPTPVIVVLVVLVLAAVTFAAIAIRRRRAGPEHP
jgi:hypothetical protein